MGNKMIKIDEYWKKVEDIPEVIRDDDWCNNPKSSR